MSARSMMLLTIGIWIGALAGAVHSETVLTVLGAAP